jgi:3D (Asp-Asp-Asp) domain-containing protein
MKQIFTSSILLILALPAAVFASETVTISKTRDNSQEGSPARSRQQAAAKAREQTTTARSRQQIAKPKSQEQAKGPVDEDQRVLARVTVYWARGGSGSDRFTRQHKAATGIKLRTGHCAVDPRRIPYGSQVIFPDGRFTAVDTGTAVINRKAARLSGRTRAEQNAVVIDRFFETKKQAENWEKTHPSYMMVRVVPPQHQMSAQRYVETTFPKAIPVDSKYPKATLAQNNYSRATLVVKK